LTVREFSLLAIVVIALLMPFASVLMLLMMPRQTTAITSAYSTKSWPFSSWKVGE
jgi:hypothetical protein